VKLSALIVLRDLLSQLPGSLAQLAFVDQDLETRKVHSEKYSL